MITFIDIAYAASEASAKAAEYGGGAELEPSGIAGSLGLDLKLFIAQLINFAIVLFILWKFVFKPVASKLSERTEKIEKALKNADLMSKEKESFGVWKKQEMVETKKQAAEIIAVARVEAEGAKEQALFDTKEEQKKLVAQAKVLIEKEKDKALREAKSEIGEMVILATEKLLGQKCDEKADRKLVSELVKTL
ncbi:MAG: F0F1 ATP synthase subunit B [Candidatus Magasanikbacteria bacterium]|nr:F0F1 ATP synthase subunit B [Candidatus Magasanikbacteria bacterium]